MAHLRRSATRALVVAVAAGIAAGASAAADEPAATSVATRGTYKLVGRVLLDATGGEMKGVWLDTKRPCTESHRLMVNVDIDLVRPAGDTVRVRRWISGAVANCAEGGPNFGFDLHPRQLRLGCRDGRWAPGRYSMTTRVRDLRTGLATSASLYRQVTRGC